MIRGSSRTDQEGDAPEDPRAKVCDPPSCALLEQRARFSLFPPLPGMSDSKTDGLESFDILGQLVHWRLTPKKLSDLAALCFRRAATPGVLFVHYTSTEHALQLRPSFVFARVAEEFRARSPALRHALLRETFGGHPDCGDLARLSWRRLISWFMTRLHVARSLAAGHPEWDDLPDELLWVPLGAVKALLVVGQPPPETVTLVWRVDLDEGCAHTNWLKTAVFEAFGRKDGAEQEEGGAKDETNKEEEGGEKQRARKVKTRPAHSTVHFRPVEDHHKPQREEGPGDDKKKCRRLRQQEARRQKVESRRRAEKKATDALDARKTVMMKPPEDKELPPEDGSSGTHKSAATRGRVARRGEPLIRRSLEVPRR